MGLNDTYAQARSQILLMTPLPTVNMAYSMIMSDENRKTVAQSVHATGLLGAAPNAADPVAMYSKTSYQGGSYQGNYQKGKRNYVSTYNPSVVCDHCKMKGHYKIDCYKLVGYPPGHPKLGEHKIQNEARTGYDHKYKQRKVASSAHNVVAEAWDQNHQNQSVGLISLPPRFTPEQYTQICKMLEQHNQVTSSMPSGSAANMSGIGSALMVCNNPPEWIIDIGATNHMTADIDLLNKDSISQAVNPKRVILPNGDVSLVTHTGCSNISENSTIQNVFHLPQFKYNLLSVSKATKQLNCTATFFPNFCVFQDLWSGKVKEIGREKNGLYFLLRQRLPGHGKVAGYAFNTQNTKKSDLRLWHNRLGHVPFRTLSHMFSISHTRVNDNINKCEVCPFAKQTRLAFSPSNTSSLKAFDLVHMDLWGPYKVPTCDGHRSFVTVVDDFTRVTWVFLLKLKTDVIVVLKHFLSYISKSI